MALLVGVGLPLGALAAVTSSLEMALCSWPAVLRACASISATRWVISEIYGGSAIMSRQSNMHSLFTCSVSKLTQT
jgi:hypothetical protein